MRVAMVCPYSLSRPGGVQGQVLGLADALRAIGTETVVVAPSDRRPGDPRHGGPPHGGPRHGDPPVEEPPHEGPSRPGPATVVVGRSVPVPANGSVAPLALDPLAWARTTAFLRRWRPDVIHVHEPLAPVVGWAALAAPVPDARRVGTLHRAGGAGLYRLTGPLARAALARLDAVFAVSEEARATAAAALGGRECPVVGNGVDLDRLAGATPVGTDGPTVLFVGRHEPRKGLALLLQATADLGPRWPGRLWIVGDGPQTAELQRRFPPGPGRRWLGRVGDEELAGLLAGAHVVCAPSLGGESFGVVLLEAMAARCVVVCSAIPGYVAVLDGHGLAVPPGDPPALASALETAVSAVLAGTGPASPAALDVAVAHAQRYSMRSLAERYHQAYEQLPDRSRPAAPRGNRSRPAAP